jgi:hypothetical protein
VDVRFSRVWSDETSAELPHVDYAALLALRHLNWALMRRAAHGLVCRASTKKQVHDSEWFLRDPRTRKWMVASAVCKSWGYRQNAPAKFFGKAHLERLQ